MMGFNKKRHLEDNILAIRTAFELEERGTNATSEERDYLKRYTGFGGLKCILQPCESLADKEKWAASEKELFAPTMMLYDMIKQHTASANEYAESMRTSVLTAFYTPKPVTKAIMKALADTGIRLNNILDPCAGTGAFVEAIKEHTHQPVTCFEKDVLTGKILQTLFPDDAIHVAGFETIKSSCHDYFDGVISNIPFGNIRVFDSAFLQSKDACKRRSTSTIHNYFFLKAVDVTREGGIIAFITSQGVMNSPRNEYIRQWLMEKCHLVSAIRLPGNLFVEEAGTEVGTDLIILQKNSRKTEITLKETAFIHTRTFDNGYSVNNFFMDFENIIYTQATKGTDPYGKPCVEFRYDKSVQELAEELQKKIIADCSLNFNQEVYAKGNIENHYTDDAQTENTHDSEEDEPLISLYDLFGIPVEERLQIRSKHRKPGETPSRKVTKKRYSGNQYSFYKDGTLIQENGCTGHLTTEIKTEKCKEKFRYYLNPLTLNDEEQKRLELYISLRDAYFNLFHHEYINKAESPHFRRKLNRFYEQYTQLYGDLNSPINRKLIQQDKLGDEILALEVFETGTKKLADIFEKPVSFRENRECQLDSSFEALAASLNQYGCVNLEHMVSVSTKTEEEILADLVGQVYFNPLIDNYEVVARFIAGDVIKKADAIDTYIGQNPDDKNLERCKQSLEALRKSTPEPIPFEELDFNLGERWISTDIYSEYASEIFGTQVTISYFIDIDNFHIEAENTYTIEITDKYAVNPVDSNKVNGLKLFSYALINTLPKITKGSGKYNLNGDEIRIPDVEAIQQANAKIDEMRCGFMEWLQGKPLEVKKSLADLYNRKFNARVIPKYEGKFQTFPGLNLAPLNIPSLYDSQYNSVWQAILNEGVIVDNSVGTGKSLIMCLIAHELKRLGLIEKPMLICLKTNVTSIVEHYTKAYPYDKVLFPTEKDFLPKNRKRLFYKMQNSNWDAIILTHEQFFKLPQSYEVERSILQKELDSVSENLRVWEKINNQSASKAMLKGLVQRKENLKARLDWIYMKMKNRRDEVVDFQTMGIDHVLVDESQEFKNLTFDTKYRNVAGLGDPKGSQRALNLLFALRTIQYKKGKDLCSTFLTATTISNSLVELYLIFKYLRPQALEDQEIRTFDAWAAVYAKKTADFEFTVTGEIKSRERFRYFKNVPELALFYNEITNFTTAKDIHIDKPESNIVLLTTPSTPEQDTFQESLIEFARTGKGELIGKDKDFDSSQSGRMLVVTDLARKAAVDMRLIDPEKYSDHPDNKLSQAAKKIAEYYYKYHEHRGTQMVLCDIGTYKPDKWNVYSELKRKLVEDYELPSHEIRFIQEAKNMDQRDRIKEDFRHGIIRVLVGHTKSLGTAMDVPDRGVCLHSLNMPWTPKDLEQRDGRLARKGNWVAKNFLGNSVNHILYASENSLDTYMFNLLQNKQTFITQLKSNSLGSRTLDEGAMDCDGSMNYSEYVAILSGNTDLLDKVKLERKVATLESEYKQHHKQVTQTQWNLETSLKELDKLSPILNGMESDWKVVQEQLPTDENGVRPNPVRLNNFDENGDPEAVGNRLIQINDSYNTRGEYYKIGSLLNFSIVVKTPLGENFNVFYIEGALRYTHNHGHLSRNPMIAATNFIRALDKIPGLIKNYKEEVGKLNRDISVMQEIIATPWRKEEELKMLKTELEALERKIQSALTAIARPENIEPDVVAIDGGTYKEIESASISA